MFDCMDLEPHHNDSASNDYTNEKYDRTNSQRKNSTQQPQENDGGCGRGGHGGGHNKTYVNDDMAGDSTTTYRDVEEEKCVGFAFRVGFPHNNRVRVQHRRLTLAGITFLLVERTIIGVNDAVYRANRKVWENVPLGQARVFIVESGGGDTYRLVAALEGLRKFGPFNTSYGVSPEPPVVAVALEAIDGESGQVAAFMHAGVRFWLIGTKDVHMLVRFDVPEEDLSVYTGDEASVTSEVARCVVNVWRHVLRSLPDGKAEALHDYLSAAGSTACFAAILQDCGHLIDYGPRETLTFYAITCRDAPSSAGLCMDPAESMTALQSFGLDVVMPQSKVVVSSEEYGALRDDIVRRLNCKGAVMYGYSEAGVLVKMWMVQSHTYAMERAAQEAIVTHRLSGEALRLRLAKKLAGLPKEVRQSLAEWESTRLDHMVHFAAWLHLTERQTARTDLSQLQALRRQWITLQRQFAQCLHADMDVRSQVIHYEPTRDDIADNEPDVIVCVGPQGCGKSTFSRTLYTLLQQAGFSPCWINQDEIGRRKQFLATIHRAQQENYTHLIIDKMNLDKITRDDYVSLGLKTLTVAWSHPDGTEALLAICTDRICRRGAGHRTLQVDGNNWESIRKILRNCAEQYRPPQEGLFMEVNVADSIPTIVKQVWAELSTHGMSDLPDIETLDIDAAVQKANAYENFTRLYPRPLEYAAILIESPETIPSLVPPEMLEGKIVQKSFHVTTLFVGGDCWTNFDILNQLISLNDQSIKLTLTRVVSDPKGTAIAVRNDNEFPCMNVHPHITVANARGVPAVYSNELLDASHEHDPDRSVFELPAGTCVTGTFALIFK